MPLSFFSIIFPLIDRHNSINIFSMKIGFGDIYLIFSVLFFYIITKKIDKIIFRLSIFFFVIILFSMILNQTLIGINTLASIPLKVLFCGIIIHEFSNLKNPIGWSKIFLTLSVILYFCLIFFSDRVLNFYEYFNTNELLGYFISALCFFIFCEFKINPYTKISLNKLFIIILILISLLLIIQSRQFILGAIMALSLLFLSINFQSKTNLLIVNLPILIIMIYFSSLFIQNNTLFKERLKIFINLEPTLRSDNYRIENFKFMIEKFDQNIFFGRGPTSYIRDNPYKKTAHSTIITTYYELGLMGLILLIQIYYFIIGFFLKSIKNYNNVSRYQILIAFLLFIIVIHSFFNDNLGKMAIYFALAISIYFLKIFKTNQS